MRALDLFCGAGGASMGLHRAGYSVVGIDIKPQPNYPFAFVQADALEPPVDLSSFDLVWASPPCQAHTTMSNRWRGLGGKTDDHLDLIGATRKMLAGVPHVIENVPGARAEMGHVVRLSGGHFGLGVHRPRLFECSFVVLAPNPAPPPPGCVGVYGKLDGRRVWTRKDGSEYRSAATIEEARDAMGIDWMEWSEIKEAIPPSYAEYLAGFAPTTERSRREQREGEKR